MLLIAWACLALSSCSGPVGTTTDGAQGGLPGYRVLRDVRLPGNTSRWDYQAYDAAAHRLYIAHLGASQIVVFDTARNRVIRVIDGVDSVHGLVLAPELGRLFASATGKNRLVAIDTATLQPIGTAPTQDYPDGIAYAASSAKLFVSNERGSGDTVIDARTVQRLDDVQLGGEIGNSYYEPGSQLVYVAIGSSSQLAVLDPRTNGVVRRLQLPGCDGAHGLQLDTAHGRAFVGCQGNGRLVVVEMASGRTQASFSVGEGPDVLSFDTGLHRLYVASEGGQVAVFGASEEVRKLAQGDVGPNAHSIAVDSTTHVAYLPLTSVQGHPVLRELVPR